MLLLKQNSIDGWNRKVRIKEQISDAENQIETPSQKPTERNTEKK